MNNFIVHKDKVQSKDFILQKPISETLKQVAVNLICITVLLPVILSVLKTGFLARRWFIYVLGHIASH